MSAPTAHVLASTQFVPSVPDLLIGAAYLVALTLVWCVGCLLLRRIRGVPGADLERLRLLEAAVAASGDGVVIAEAGDAQDLAIVYANPAFERLTGYTADEVVGRSPSMLRDQDSEPAALEAVRAALRGTEPARLEVPSRRKDGTRLCTEWLIVPVADPAGRYTHRVAVLRDTTGRQRAERAVRESEERFRGLFEQAADAIFVLTPHGRILEANRQACASLGYTPDELMALDFADIQTVAPGGTSSAGGLAQTRTLQVQHRRKDGSTFPVEVRVGSLDAGGRQLTLAIVRDLSRRRQAEDALRRSEALLRLVWDSAAEGMRLTDAAGTVLMANAAYCRAVARSPAEVVGRPLADAYDPARREDVLRKHRERFAARAARTHVEAEVALWDGRSRWFDVSNAYLDESAERPLQLAVIRDVTDRKRLEEQLRQKQKMEAIGQLAGGVAHDFNNLLTVIRGNADLLQDRLPVGSGPAGLLAEVCLAADRAAGLVRQLLMFSRRQPSHPEVIDLNAVVADLAGMLRRLLGERVMVETALAPRPVTVRADRTHLEQVVMNLAVNARDAMPAGGTLTIGTEAVADGAGRYARLVVSDTGVGMTDAVRGRLFEPFFTTKGPDQGTGLGLATVYGIVQQAAGRVGVDSAPGAGATFRIDFPWHDAPAPLSTVVTAQDATRREPAGGGRSVLLVEDEDGVRKFARYALEGRGYAVAEAGDGEAALGLLAPDYPLDLLVTDLTMPGMGGRELAGRVRAARPWVGVVFVSGYVPEDGHLDGVPGAVFLPKPYTPAALLRAADEALPRADAPRDGGRELVQSSRPA